MTLAIVDDPDLEDVIIVDDDTCSHMIVTYVFGEYPQVQIAETFVINKDFLSQIYQSPERTHIQRQIDNLFVPILRSVK
jgi:hypothetical protein